VNLILREIRGTPLLWLLVFVPLALAGEHLWPEAGTLLFLLSISPSRRWRRCSAGPRKRWRRGPAMRWAGC
jgi:hypothetical protein